MSIDDVLGPIAQDLRRARGLAPVDRDESDRIMRRVEPAPPSPRRIERGLAEIQRRARDRPASARPRPSAISESFARGTTRAQVHAVLLTLEVRRSLRA